MRNKFFLFRGDLFLLFTWSFFEPLDQTQKIRQNNYEFPFLFKENETLSPQSLLKRSQMEIWIEEAKRQGEDAQKAQEGVQAFLEGRALRYTPKNGITTLRNRLSEDAVQNRGLDYSPEEVFVAPGIDVLSFNLLMAVTSPGDHVWMMNGCNQVLERAVSDVNMQKIDKDLPAAIAHAQKKGNSPKIIFLGSLDRYLEDELKELTSFAQENQILLVFNQTTLMNSDRVRSLIQTLVGFNPEFLMQSIFLMDEERFWGLENWKLATAYSKNANYLNVLSLMADVTYSVPNEVVQRGVLHMLGRPDENDAGRSVTALAAQDISMNVWTQEALQRGPSATLIQNELALITPGSISLGFGESRFQFPDELAEEIRDNHQNYAEVLISFINAIRAYFTATRRPSYQPQEILVAQGVKPLIFTALRSITQLSKERGLKGVSIAIPKPYWVSYPSISKMMTREGLPVEVLSLDSHDENRFLISDEDLVSTWQDTPDDVTKVLILNGPNNPVAQTYSKEDLIAIGKYTRRNNVYIISDEIYSLILSENGEHYSLASLEDEVQQALLEDIEQELNETFGPEESEAKDEQRWRKVIEIEAFRPLKELTVLLDGMSKNFAAGGLRVGFAASQNQDLIQRMKTLNIHQPDILALRGALGVLKDLDSLFAYIQRHRQFLRQGARILQRALEEMDIPFIANEGSFYVFPQIDSTFFGKSDGTRTLESSNFSMSMFHETHVTSIEGSSFGMPGYLRLAFPFESEQMMDATRRIAGYYRKIIQLSGDERRLFRWTLMNSDPWGLHAIGKGPLGNKFAKVFNERLAQLKDKTFVKAIDASTLLDERGQLRSLGFPEAVRNLKERLSQEEEKADVKIVILNLNKELNTSQIAQALEIDPDDEMLSIMDLSNETLTSVSEYLVNQYRQIGILPQDLTVAYAQQNRDIFGRTDKVHYVEVPEGSDQERISALGVLMATLMEDESFLEAFSEEEQEELRNLIGTDSLEDVLIEKPVKINNQEYLEEMLRANEAISRSV